MTPIEKLIDLLLYETDVAIYAMKPRAAIIGPLRTTDTKFVVIDIGDPAHMPDLDALILEAKK